MSFTPYSLVVALLLVLAAGCQLDLQLGVTLDDAGGGELELQIAVDQQLVEAAADVGADPLATLVQRVEALEGPWEVVDVTPPDSPEGGRVVAVRAGFGDPQEFAARYEELRSGLDAPEGRLLAPLELTVGEEGGPIRLRGTVPLEVTELAAAEQEMEPAELTATLADAVSHRVVVVTPVPVLEEGSQQGVEQEDGREVISLPVPLGEEVAVDVAFQPPGLDVAQLVLYVGGGVLAVLLVLAGVLAERRANASAASLFVRNGG